MNCVCPVIGYDRLGLTGDWLERFGRVRGEYKQSVLTCVSSFWLLSRSLIDFIPLSFFVCSVAVRVRVRNTALHKLNKQL